MELAEIIDIGEHRLCISEKELFQNVPEDIRRIIIMSSKHNLSDEEIIEEIDNLRRKFMAMKNVVIPLSYCTVIYYASKELGL